MLTPPASEPIRRHDLLILDTGPIRELVLFHAVSEFGFQRLRTDLQWLTTQDSYDRCGQFIALFKRKTTSASVVAELQYWIRDTEKHGRSKLWQRVYDEFRFMGLDEELIKLLEMEPQLVSRFGPVDGSLIELARRHQEQRPLILTIDSALYGECKKAGFAVSHVQEVSLSAR